MKQLIINSDDYGRTPEISHGIREAHLHGVVTSTTCMMNIPTTADDIAIALKKAPNLGMGVHLVLTMGRPISAPDSVPSIVDENGNFFKYTPLVEHLTSLNMDEVKKEWRFQIEAFIKASGRRPTHIDSHHHSSYFSPNLFRGMLELAQEYDCAIRFPFTEVSSEIEETAKHVPDLMQEFNPRRPDVFFVNFYDKTATEEDLLRIIASVEEGKSEIMCHPGYVDDAFAKESVYNFQRERELKILTESAIKQAIEAQNIKLITFADL
ncbi:MAG TPA: carbohydrate deacetylase [Anaerolineales bacterium]|nr:carbohydrate deacetylase [Anaerolineales bacterium]